MSRIYAAGLVAAAFFSTGVLPAQDAELFQKLDANKDGVVTLDEVPDEHKAKFEQLLKIAGKEAEKKLGLPLFQAALKHAQSVEKTDRQPEPAPAVDAAGLFAKLDANRDGLVTGEEVPEGQKALFERLVRTADRDGDKKLSQREFQAGLAPDEGPRQPLAGGFPGRPGAGAPPVNPRQFFDRLDANKDGKLTKEELPPRIQEGFARLDADGDGSLSAEELARGGMALLQRPGAPGAPGLPSPEQLAEQFERLDANKDGKLTKDEVPEERQFMRRVLERADAAGLTKEQFLRAMGELGRAAGQPGSPQRRPDGSPPMGMPIDALRPALAAIDANRDGELSKEEIEGAAKALLTLDKNGDGKLTRDEIGGPPPGGRPMRRPEGPPPESRRPDNR